MRAIVLHDHGDADVLSVEDVPAPVAGPEEVLVQVRSTALNRADLLQRRGLYPGPPMEHEIPGMEFAGEVTAVGERVSERSVGDAVMGIVAGGAYAEQLVVHERQTMGVPSTVSLADAAAIPEVFITAWDALVRQGGLTIGGVALVHAGASGVGSAAIQIARAVGASALATASTGKVDACRDFGADLVVDYTAEDFVDAVRAHTGSGVDVILDVIGGDYVNRNIACLKTGGRIIQVGVMGSGRAEIDVGTLLPKRATITGTVLRSRPLEEKIAVTRGFAAEMLPAFETGALVPVIDSRYPLAEIAAAHRHMEANANIGKILIDLR